jgi:hypothetical protein
MSRAPKLCRYTAEMAPDYQPPLGWERCACCDADVRVMTQAEGDAGQSGRGVAVTGGVVCIRCWGEGLRPGDRRRCSPPESAKPSPQLPLMF